MISPRILENKCIAFWRENPALFVGIHLLLGAASALSYHPIFLLILLLLWTPLWRTPLKLSPYAILLSTAFAYTSFLYPPLPHADKISGTAYVSFSLLKPHASPFQRGLQYKGTILSFQSDGGEVLHRLPCSIYHRLNKKRPLADSDYLITGTLIRKKGHALFFKPAKEYEWQKVPNTTSFAEWRYQTKEKVRSYLKNRIPHPRSFAFLSALLLGDLEDRTLALEFSKLGLQHILAISGFHFALLAAFFGFLFRLILPRQLAACLLILFLTAYAFFIGGASSVQRGWIALIIVLIGNLLHMRTTGLNALGIGLILALLIDPATVTDLGFQLSFLATSAILLLYPTINRLFSFILPKRKLGDVAAMSTLDQHGYIFSALIREGLSLNLSVLLFVLPLLLATVHQFPLLSIIYNLFFPVWTTLVFFLLLCALTLSFIPPFATLIHSFNSALTAPLLDLTAYPPALFDFTVRSQTFPFTLLILWITTLFFSSILLQKKLT